MIEFTLRTSVGSAHSRTVEVPEVGAHRLVVLRGGDDITVTLELESEHAARYADLRTALGGEPPAPPAEQGLTDRLVADLTAARAELDEERARVGRLDAMLQDRDRQVEGLTAERDRLRQRESWRMARTYDAMAAEVAQARVERDVLADQERAVRDLATGWILTGEAAAKTHGRAVIARLDGRPE